VGNVNISITNVPTVISAIEDLKRRCIDAVRDATEEAGDTLRDKARANFQGSHPSGFPHVGGDRPNWVSGQLAQSITAWPLVQEGPYRFMVQVNPTTVYSRIIELGGTIVPRQAQYLSWFSPYMGRQMFKRSVTLRGWPYLRPATEEMITDMLPIFERHMLEAWHA